MTTPTKPTKEATTPLPVLTEDDVKTLRAAHRLCGDPVVAALADHWLRTQAGWQPIETAPRDGSIVLLCWSDIHDRPLTGYFDGVEWVIALCASRYMSQPTHWCPLPPPPQEPA